MDIDRNEDDELCFLCVKFQILAKCTNSTILTVLKL